MRALWVRCGEAVRWLGLALRLAVGGLFALALASLLPSAVLGLAWLHVDALFERRLRWVSGPLMIAVDAWVGSVLVRSKLDERRLRRELPDKLRSRAVLGPLCDGPLPSPLGDFERCPLESLVRWGDRGRPEGCFRLGCEACGRDVWFAAWLDGTVRPHPEWILKYKYGIEL